MCVVVALDLAMIGLEWEENHVGGPKFVLKNAWILFFYVFFVYFVQCLSPWGTCWNIIQFTFFIYACLTLCKSLE